MSNEIQHQSMTHQEISDESHQQEISVDDDNVTIITRLELFQLMHGSKLPVADNQGQMELLRKYIVSKFEIEFSDENLEQLDNSIHFFLLEIRKRFLGKGIRQNYEKMIYKYTKTLDSFLSKQFDLPEGIVNLEKSFFDGYTENLTECSSPEMLLKKSQLGMGTLRSSQLLTTSELLTNQQKGKIVRRVGLNKNYKIASLHF
jgi:hypothetical protein